MPQVKEGWDFFHILEKNMWITDNTKPTQNGDSIFAEISEILHPTEEGLKIGKMCLSLLSSVILSVYFCVGTCGSVSSGFISCCRVFKL